MGNPMPSTRRPIIPELLVDACLASRVPSNREKYIHLSLFHLAMREVSGWSWVHSPQCGVVKVEMHGMQ